MAKILNEVQFLHKLNSTHVLKFHNWYESSNHIWIIFEFCIGGDLLNLITLDKSLPESSIKNFGHDLVMGLHYLHTNGTIYCDLKPANVLIDEYGCLKLSDFGLARKIPTEESVQKDSLAPGSPHYMAPELFEQIPVHSFASDFWALGCVLYELRAGVQPFANRGFLDLRNRIQTTELELPPKNVEMSDNFCHLLRRLMEKDPAKRIAWDELLNHPFWETRPDILTTTLPSQEYFTKRYPPTQSSILVEHISPKNDRINVETLQESLPAVETPSERRSIASNVSTSTCSNDSEAKTRPATAPIILSKPKEESPQVEDPISSENPSPPPPKTAPLPQHSRPKGPSNLTVRDARKRIFTTADCVVKPIVACNEIEKVSVPRINESSLPFTTVSASSMTKQRDIEEKLEEIYHYLRGDASVAEKHNALAYLYSLSTSSKFANIIVNSSLLDVLVKLLEQSTSSALSSRLCLVLGTMIRYATFIAPDVFSDIKPDALIFVLTKILSNNDNVQITRRAMACLGELGFYMSTQSANFGSPVVDCFIRGLQDPDSIVRHYAVQTVCNILTQGGSVDLVAHFVSPSAVQALIQHGLLAKPSNHFRVSIMQTLSQVLKHVNSSQFADVQEAIFSITEVHLPLIWENLEFSRSQVRWTISSLNVLNSTLEFSTRKTTDQSTMAFLDTITRLDDIRDLLNTREHEELSGQAQHDESGRFKDVDVKLTNLVHGKTILLMYFGLQISREFTIRFVNSSIIETIEPILATSESNASFTKKYALHSAQQLVALLIRVALEVSFSLVDESTIPLLPLFEGLFHQLLSYRSCRQYLLDLLFSSEDYEAFIMGISNLLQCQHAANAAVNILVLIFDSGDDIVSHVEDLDLLWFDTAFIQIVRILGDSSWSPDILVNCVRIIYKALMLFPPSSNTDEFIVHHLLPVFHELLRANTTDESVRRFAAELLHAIVHRDIAFVTILHELKLIQPILGLLNHTMSTSVTKLLLYIQQSGEVPMEDLYNMEIVTSLATSLIETQHQDMLAAAEDLCEIMYALLYEHYVAFRNKTSQESMSIYRRRHRVFLKCIPSLLRLCVATAGTHYASSETTLDDLSLCEKAARCFSVISQLFEMEAHEWLMPIDDESPMACAVLNGSASVQLRCLQGLKVILRANRGTLKLPRRLCDKLEVLSQYAAESKVAGVASEVLHLVE
ncbi:Serine threonine kinase [Aphanomyces cochlioides]|nr:Serine threonine kinase [Aphanomyces cochlioides]